MQHRADTPQPSGSASGSGSGSSSKKGMWSEILRSADRQNTLGRKNLIILSERHHGRKQLIERMMNSTSGPKRRKKDLKVGAKGGLALGYEVLEIRDEGDEESAPPLSVYYPPSSHPSFTKLVSTALPPKSLSDTAIMILLDWTKPASMIKELLYWLSWITDWAEKSLSSSQAEEMREKLQSHIQHYVEPAAPTPTANTSSPLSTPALPSISSVYGSGPLLPLGQGTLTHNLAGLPIMVVCTKADLMDNAGDEAGMKGAAWEEKTDWVQQVLRTVCLSYGASLFYTATTQPDTYSTLTQYLLHQLYTTPPPLNPTTDAPLPAVTTRFPFPYRANVLDRDAVRIPAGWDSWGKISVLREGFDPARVGRAWDTSLTRMRDGETEGEGVEELWEAAIPIPDRGPKTKDVKTITTASEPEQSFLSRQLDLLQKDTTKDPRQSFRNAIPSSTTASSGNTTSGAGGGVVGPMGNTGLGLNLPGVEKAMLEMEGSGLTGEELKEKFARLGRRETSKTGPLSPTAPPTPGAAPAVPNEALHNFFQGLLANKGKAAAKDKDKSAEPASEAAK